MNKASGWARMTLQLSLEKAVLVQTLPFLFAVMAWML